MPHGWSCLGLLCLLALLESTSVQAQPLNLPQGVCRNHKYRNFPLLLTPKDRGESNVELADPETGALVGQVRIYPLIPVSRKWRIYIDIWFERLVGLYELGFGIYNGEHLIPGNIEEVDQLLTYDTYDPVATGFKDKYQSNQIIFTTDIPSDMYNCCDKDLQVVARAKYDDGEQIKYAAGLNTFRMYCNESVTLEVPEKLFLSDKIRTDGARAVEINEKFLMVQKPSGDGSYDIRVMKRKFASRPGASDKYVDVQTLKDTITTGDSINFGSSIRLTEDTAIIRTKDRRLALYGLTTSGTWTHRRFVGMAKTVPNTGAAIYNDFIAFVHPFYIRVLRRNPDTKKWEKEADLKRVWTGRKNYSLEFDMRGRVVACHHFDSKCFLFRRDAETARWSWIQTFSLRLPLAQSVDGTVPVIATAEDSDKSYLVTLHKQLRPSSKFGHVFLLNLYEENVKGKYVFKQGVNADLGVDGISPDHFTVRADGPYVVVSGRNKIIAHLFKIVRGNLRKHLLLRTDLDRGDPRNPRGAPNFPNRGANQIAIRGRLIISSFFDDYLEPQSLSANITH